LPKNGESWERGTKVKGDGQECRPTWLLLYEFCEHFFGVDGDEEAAAAGEDFVFVVENFGGVDVLAAVYADFPALDVQRFVQRDGLQVFDCHFFGQSNYVVEFVDLAHGVVEDAGDDAAVAVAGGSGVAFAQAEFADEGLTLLVEGELQAHAFGIVEAADEAVIFLHFYVASVVAFGLAGHG
jgi:hypothetical protein